MAIVSTRRPYLGLLGACTLAASLPSAAQVERSGGGESQKFMQQYQQLAAEKTSLQAQLAQMKKDLDSAKADLAAMKKERDALKAPAGAAAVAAERVTQLTALKESADKSAEHYKQRLNELVDRFRELGDSFKEVEGDRGNLRKELAERNAAFDQCAENNLRLFEISKDVLDRYEHVGLFTKTGATEPFTQITRTRIENLVDEYRARAVENRVKKPPP
jgi:chromosome segregation ATPase